MSKIYQSDVGWIQFRVLNVKIESSSVENAKCELIKCRKCQRWTIEWQKSESNSNKSKMPKLNQELELQKSINRNEISKSQSIMFRKGSQICERDSIACRKVI